MKPKHLTTETKEESISAVVSLALLAFALVTAEFIPISLLTSMAADLDISLGAAGLMITVTAIAATCSGPAILLLCRETNRKKLLLWLVGALVLSCIASAVANSGTSIMLARVLTGVSLGGFWTLSAALVIQLVPPHRVAQSLALVAVGVSAAIVSAGSLATLLGQVIGWRATMLGIGIFSAAVLVTCGRVLPDMAPVAAYGRPYLIQTAMLPSVAGALGVLLLIVSGHFAAFTYIRPLLEAESANTDWISARLLIFGLCGVAGNFLGGTASTRSPACSTACTALLLSAAGICIITHGVSGYLGAISIGMWGTAFGAAPVCMQTYLLTLAPKRAETLGALNLVSFQWAIAAGTLLGSSLIGPFGPHSTLLLLIAFPTAAAILISVMQRPAPRAQD